MTKFYTQNGSFTQTEADVAGFGYAEDVTLPDGTVAPRWQAGLIAAQEHLVFGLRGSATDSFDPSAQTIGSTITFNTEPLRPWFIGSWVRAEKSTDSTVFIEGDIASYDVDTGALDLTVRATGGSGTVSDWTLKNLGRAGRDLNNRGAWNSSDTYNPLDVVNHDAGSGLKSWVANVQNTNSEPGPNNSDWSVIGALAPSADIEENGTKIVSGASAINFGAGLTATDDGDGSASVSAITSLSQLPARDIGQTSTNVTLDLSKNSVFELEPTADITIDITGLASSGSRARGIINGINLGSQTLTWTVNGASADSIFSRGSLSLVKNTAYDISAASFNQSFDVSGQGSNPQGMAWNSDGTKMYVAGQSNDSIYEYALSTAYDIGTASFSQSLDVSGQDTSPRDVAWNGDGTKMYMAGASNDSIYEYALSTAYDIGTASFSQSLNVGSEDGNPNGMAWNSDGTKMYVAGSNNDSIYEYTLSTAYDIGTASFSQSLDVSSENSFPTGVSWNNDGTKMYMVGSSSDGIFEYTLSTAYDIGTASFSQSLDVGSEDASPNGMTWNSDGTKMYMVGANNDNIYEYTGFSAVAKQELRLEQFGTGQVLISD